MHQARVFMSTDLYPFLQRDCGTGASAERRPVALFKNQSVVALKAPAEHITFSQFTSPAVQCLDGICPEDYPRTRLARDGHPRVQHERRVWSAAGGGRDVQAYQVNGTFFWNFEFVLSLFFLARETREEAGEEAPLMKMRVHYMAKYIHAWLKNVPPKTFCSCCCALIPPFVWNSSIVKWGKPRKSGLCSTRFPLRRSKWWLITSSSRQPIEIPRLSCRLLRLRMTFSLMFLRPHTISNADQSGSCFFAIVLCTKKEHQLVELLALVKRLF